MLHWIPHGTCGGEAPAQFDIQSDTPIAVGRPEFVRAIFLVGNWWMRVAFREPRSVTGVETGASSKKLSA
jgi:hypothetical protein